MVDKITRSILSTIRGRKERKQETLPLPKTTIGTPPKSVASSLKTAKEDAAKNFYDLPPEVGLVSVKFAIVEAVKQERNDLYNKRFRIRDEVERSRFDIDYENRDPLNEAAKFAGRLRKVSWRMHGYVAEMARKDPALGISMTRQMVEYYGKKSPQIFTVHLRDALKLSHLDLRFYSLTRDNARNAIKQIGLLPKFSDDGTRTLKSLRIKAIPTYPKTRNSPEDNIKATKEYFLENPEMSEEITDLDLSDMDLGPEIGKLLAQAIQPRSGAEDHPAKGALSNLKSLSVGGNEMGDRGILPIIEALPNSKITSLSLVGWGKEPDEAQFNVSLLKLAETVAQTKLEKFQHSHMTSHATVVADLALKNHGVDTGEASRPVSIASTDWADILASDL